MATEIVMSRVEGAYFQGYHESGRCQVKE